MAYVGEKDVIRGKFQEIKVKSRKKLLVFLLGIPMIVGIVYGFIEENNLATVYPEVGFQLSDALVQGVAFGTIGAVIGFFVWLFIIACDDDAKKLKAIVDQMEICVTTKRVWGKFLQGNSVVGVDLPIRSISAVTLANSDQIGIASSGGQFTVSHLENRDDVYQAIKGLIDSLTEEDTNNSSQNVVDTIAEIRKYKKLMDEGIITEEEYIEKKKKLMGNG